MLTPLSPDEGFIHQQQYIESLKKDSSSVRKRYKLFRNSLFVSYILAYILSAPMLELLGIPYTSNGGSFVFKVHIYSLIILTLFFSLLARKSLRVLVQPPVPGLGSAPLLFVVGTLWVAGYGVYQSGLGGMAYIVDSLLSPSVAIFLLPILKTEDQKLLLRIIAGLLIFNACIAVFEYLTRIHLILNADPQSFRSSALMAHPLNNALILLSCYPLFIREFNQKKQLLITFLCFLAMFAFGARASTVVFFLMLAGLFGTSFLKFLYGRIGIPKSIFLYLYFGSILALPIMLLLIESTGIGSRIFQNLSIEGASAQTRFDVYNIFYHLRLNEWLFGANGRLMEMLPEIINNGIIENFWIGWLLQFGLIGLLPIGVAFLYLFVRLMLIRDLYLKAASVSFLLASYTNNSLSAKTPALLFFFTLASIVIYNRKYEIIRSNKN